MTARETEEEAVGIYPRDSRIAVAAVVVAAEVGGEAAVDDGAAVDVAVDCISGHKPGTVVP